MKILEYQYSGIFWEIHKVNFQDINLIVGDSGSGKTRLFNTIFNIGRYVAQNEIKSGGDEWKITLGVDDDIFLWSMKTIIEENKVVVVSEELSKNNKLIIMRDKDEFKFNEEAMPKFPINVSALSILKEEEIIKPLYDGFSMILRRKFFEDALQKSSGIFSLNKQALIKLGKENDLFEGIRREFGLSPRLFMLREISPDTYHKIIAFYKETFEFISQIEFLDSTELDFLEVASGSPILCIKEFNVEKWIRLDELSSGMQKVLLILTDLFSLPNGSIYLIDEYENSLGVGAIDFLPNLLEVEKLDKQIFITSHHPYIINNFPVANWYIAHRKGSEVQIAHGDELKARYGISKQEKYLQLLNDPYYSEGVE